MLEAVLNAGNDLFHCFLVQFPGNSRKGCLPGASKNRSWRKRCPHLLCKKLKGMVSIGVAIDIIDIPQTVNIKGGNNLPVCSKRNQFICIFLKVRPCMEAGKQIELAGDVGEDQQDSLLSPLLIQMD